MMTPSEVTANEGDDYHTYHAFPGHAKSVLTRALWAFTPLKKGEGSTLFVSGSQNAQVDCELAYRNAVKHVTSNT